MGKDVVIVGAGIVGCATAYFLARDGVGVTVVDPFGIAAGASGRNNGLIEHTYDAATVELFDESVGLLREFLGAAMPKAPVGALLLADEERAARELLAHYEQFPELSPVLLDPDAARLEEPLLADGLWGCLLETGFPISPREATEAVAGHARAAGANFLVGPEHAVRDYYLEGIIDSRASQHPNADAVVIAAGATTGAVLNGLLPSDAVKPLWGVIALVEMARRPRHPIIEGTVTRGLTTGRIENVSPFTLLDSPSWLAVGSTLLEGDEPDGDPWSRRLLDQGTRFVPSLARARLQGTLVCARPKSFDNRPILGRVPGQKRLWVATGHGGRGMSLGAASGRLMAEAIIAGDDAGIPAELSARRLSG